MLIVVLLALSGSRHLAFLLDNKLINPISLPQLELIYSEQNDISTAKANKNDSPSEEHSQKKQSQGNDILIDVAHGKELAKVLGAPELAAEVERAVGQVEHMYRQEKDK